MNVKPGIYLMFREEWPLEALKWMVDKKHLVSFPTIDALAEKLTADIAKGIIPQRIITDANEFTASQRPGTPDVNYLSRIYPMVSQYDSDSSLNFRYMSVSADPAIVRLANGTGPCMDKMQFFDVTYLKNFLLPKPGTE